MSVRARDNFEEHVQEFPDIFKDSSYHLIARIFINIKERENIYIYIIDEGR